MFVVAEPDEKNLGQHKPRSWAHQLYGFCNELCRDLGGGTARADDWDRWRPFVGNVQSALQAIAPSSVVLFRGARFQNAQLYADRQTVVWGGFSSGSLDRSTAADFMGDAGLDGLGCTYFGLLSDQARAIFFASMYAEELEFLHPANLPLEVCRAMPPSVL